MPTGKITAWTLVIGCLFCLFSARATPVLEPTVQISQNGHTYEDLTPLSSPNPAYRYYRYRHSTGHPAFGLAHETATVSLFWDSTTDVLSLIFISGDDDSGKGMVTVTGLPRAASLALSDDPGEFTFSPRKGRLTGNFSYGHSTDGFVLSTPDTATFTAELAVKPKLGIDALRVTNGDPTNGGSFLKLNLSEPLFIRLTPGAGQSDGGSQGGGSQGSSGGGVTTPVPEPTTLAAFSLVIPLLLRRRTRQ